MSAVLAVLRWLWGWVRRSLLGGGVAWAGPESSAASGSSDGDGSDSGPVRKALKAARAGMRRAQRAGVPGWSEEPGGRVLERAAAAAGESEAVSVASKVASSSKRSRVVGGSSDSCVGWGAPPVLVCSTRWWRRLRMR